MTTDPQKVPGLFRVGEPMRADVTVIEGATATFDDDGRERVVLATCGHCGRTWNDAAVSHLTPVPAGRCPFEYEHEYPDDE